MNFKEEYKKAQDAMVEEVDIVGKKTGDEAILDLNKADQSEVYRFECYSEGIFNYISEDKTRIIAVGFTTHVGIVLPCFATIPDLLITRGRDYIEIRLFE